MKEIQTKTNNLLIIEVPEDVTWYRITALTSEQSIITGESIISYLQYGKKTTNSNHVTDTKV